MLGPYRLDRCISRSTFGLEDPFAGYAVLIRYLRETSG